MRTTARRGLAASIALVAALGAGTLTACSSGDSGGSASPSASATTSEGAGMIGPVIVEPGQAEATVSVGRMIVFNVANPVETTITSSDPAVLAVTPGSDDGSAVFNPGGEALAAGTAEVTLVDSVTGEERVVTVTVTE